MPTTTLNCDPNALAQAAKCFKCLPAPTLLEVQTYLLALAAGGSLDPKVLAEQAKCFKCLSPSTLLEIQVYLLCQLSGQ